MHQVDQPTLQYARERYPDIIGWLPGVCLQGKQPSFNATRFLTARNTLVTVLAVKPVYYEALGGYIRPLSEITDYHGNRRIILNDKWRNATFRYIDWLTKRQKLFGQELLLPSLFGDWHIQEIARPQINVGLTTTTVYPDPNPESTTVDGETGHGLATTGTSDWNSLVNQTGNDANDSAAGFICGYIFSATASGNWRRIYRGIALFDTSSISSGDTISSAVLSVHGISKSDGTSNSPSTCVYTSNPASNTALVAGDFDSFGSTALANDISYASFSTSGYNDFTLNGTGISNVNKGGITKLGFRNKNYDADNVKPSNWSASSSSDTRAYSADDSGTSRDPKLVVEHSAGGGGFIKPNFIGFSRL